MMKKLERDLQASKEVIDSLEYYKRQMEDKIRSISEYYQNQIEQIKKSYNFSGPNKQQVR